MQRIIAIRHPNGARSVYPTVFEPEHDAELEKTAEYLHQMYPQATLGLVEIQLDPEQAEPLNQVH